MALTDIAKALFGGGVQAITSGVTDVAEVFRPNAEAADQRAADAQNAALAQMAGEFQQQNRSWFDRLMDGINRIPRPALALGTLGLFVAAMVDPIWFAERMQGLALVPEPMWWLLGAIVSFYFGARSQAKSQEFQRSIAATTTLVPRVVENIRTLRALRHDSPGVAEGGDVPEVTDNPALSEWLRGQK